MLLHGQHLPSTSFTRVHTLIVRHTFVLIDHKCQYLNRRSEMPYYTVQCNNIMFTRIIRGIEWNVFKLILLYLNSFRVVFGFQILLTTTFFSLIYKYFENNVYNKPGN